jgi:hypothetical protein
MRVHGALEQVADDLVDALHDARSVHRRDPTTLPRAPGRFPVVAGGFRE